MKTREEEGRTGAVLGCFVGVYGWPKLWRDVEKSIKDIWAFVQAQSERNIRLMSTPKG